VSESDKFEAQGKAHASLKEARSNIHTITTSLNDYSRCLQELSRLVDRFVKDPHFKNANLIALSEHLKASLLQLQEPNAVARLVDELVAESNRSKVLQEQVDRF